MITIFRLFENKDEMLYHGTTNNWWNKTEDGETYLYLVNDEKEAGRYAYETAINDECHDLEPEPIVCSISMNELKELDLKFEPDWGGVDVIDDSTWEDTYKSFGSFSVYGKIDNIKSHFKMKDIREY